jgi:hypothetical protein
MWSPGWGPSQVELVPLRQVEKTLQMHMDRKKATWGHSKKATVCKPRREASGKIKPANILILDFQSPELLEIKFLLLKPLNL